MDTIFDPSVESTTSARGSADRHTDVSKTMPISSASSICSSRAAASSSFAIAKDTAKDRSDPMEESASVAAAPFGIAIDADVSCSGYNGHNLKRGEIARASAEGFTVSKEGQLGPLRLRRFVFSSTGPYSKPEKRVKCMEGTRHRKRIRPSSEDSESFRGVGGGRSSICFATTFGATLKTVLDFAGIGIEKKKRVADALDDMADFLSPISNNINHISGSDRDHLVSGLATQSVGRRQQKFLSECEVDTQLKKTWLYKSGQANVTLGATAAILVAHYVLAVTGSRPNEVIDNLTRSITVTRNLLEQWNSQCFATNIVYGQALGAEIRALERARASALTAERVAAAQGLDRLTSLHLQLSYMREAAWPAHAVCEEGRTHESNLENLRNGKSIRIDGIPLGPDGTVVPPSRQTLCLLGKDLSKFKGFDDDTSSESGVTWSASSASSLSSLSSIYTPSSASTVFDSDDEEEEEEESAGAGAGVYRAERIATLFEKL